MPIPFLVAGVRDLGDRVADVRLSRPDRSRQAGPTGLRVSRLHQVARRVPRPAPSGSKRHSHPQSTIDGHRPIIGSNVRIWEEAKVPTGRCRASGADTPRIWATDRHRRVAHVTKALGIEPACERLSVAPTTRETTKNRPPSACVPHLSRSGQDPVVAPRAASTPPRTGTVSSPTHRTTRRLPLVQASGFAGVLGAAAEPEHHVSRALASADLRYRVAVPGVSCSNRDVIVDGPWIQLSRRGNASSRARYSR